MFYFMLPCEYKFIGQIISLQRPTNYLLMKETMLMNCRVSKTVIANIKPLLFFAALGSSQTENEIVKYNNSDFEKMENLIGSSNCKYIVKMEVPDDPISITCP